MYSEQKWKQKWTANKPNKAQKKTITLDIQSYLLKWCFRYIFGVQIPFLSFGVWMSRVGSFDFPTFFLFEKLQNSDWSTYPFQTYQALLTIGFP